MKKILIAILCMVGLAFGIVNAQAATIDVNSKANNQSTSLDLTKANTTSVDLNKNKSTSLDLTKANTTGATAAGNITKTSTTQGTTSKVPEPASMLLLALGFLGLAGLKRKFKR